MASQLVTGRQGNSVWVRLAEDDEVCSATTEEEPGRHSAPCLLAPEKYGSRECLYVLHISGMSADPDVCAFKLAKWVGI